MTARQLADIETGEAERAAKATVGAAKFRAAAILKTRNALREALAAANASDVYAAQGGVYGAIEDVLRMMGEGDSLDRWVETGEWGDE